MLNSWSSSAWGLFGLFCLVQAQQAVIPAPNSTYNVGRVTMQITNMHSLQVLSPNQNEAPELELSVFYPTDTNETVLTPYMPPTVALFQDQEHAAVWEINSPNGTFERLSMQLAPNGSTIAQSNTPWSFLVFSSALGTNRNLYNALVSQVASSGYVVVSYDTPYDTDIVQYSNGSITVGVDSVLNDTNIDSIIASATAITDLRAQDASFIVDQFSNDSFVSSKIPGCNACLNTTRVGMFGHSIGGGAATTATLNDTRIAGTLDFDGTLWGDVVQKGLDTPYFLMVEEGNTRNAFNESPGDSWAQFWPHLKSSKFDLVLNGSSHNTFSDYPLVFELLDILPTNDTILDGILLTRMNGTRALHIVTTYATSFFDWLFKNGTAALIAAPSPLFPEVSLDTNTTSLEEASKGPPGSDGP